MKKIEVGGLMLCRTEDEPVEFKWFKTPPQGWEPARMNDLQIEAVPPDYEIEVKFDE